MVRRAAAEETGRAGRPEALGSSTAPTSPDAEAVAESADAGAGAGAADAADAAVEADAERGAAVLTEAEAERHVAAVCLTAGPPRLLGVELEWLVHDLHDPALPLAPERLAAATAAVGALPGGSRLTTEPGGQLEISSRPAPTLAACLTATGHDVDRLRTALRAHGLAATGLGVDPRRPPRRLLEHPRYVAMEGYFDRANPWGRAMMCSTASVQICVDAGDEGRGPSGLRWRWWLAHALGPVLVAAFANSPLRLGRPTGLRSTRQFVWSRLDPGRTSAPGPYAPGPYAPGSPHGRVPPLPGSASADGWRPPGDAGTFRRMPGHAARRSAGRPPVVDAAGPTALPALPADPDRAGDPREQWARYALNAPVLCVRSAPGRPWTAPPGLTFRRWITGGGDRPPTLADLDYHLTTLFPPVRPHGHLELRMIDAQPDDGWTVPLTLVDALLADPAAGGAAAEALLELAGRAGAGAGTEARPGAEARPPRDPLWTAAARHGLADPALHRAALACFAAARDALPRLGAPAAARRALDAFAERYVEPGRCPADDHLDRLHPLDHPTEDPW
ncbi:glutamate-cysteine ligase family protein [Allostreptomyces psammosilenae]|uniref:Glutamate--cysteine ligase EgtA n=1 Tax=Allostreptomyces psammosilenae TaxID=1892865 RepID=A0A852ZYS9_9ACTN|nr:glutamate-cysteine ligase family protein [Allostreptomyces psammosilenae]NYI06390.1 glutamate--cysteine ligase [Allostreptomyces psammosilenae]